MDKLLKLAVQAHGGLRAWNRLRTLTANVSIGGALWDLKKLPGLFRNTRVDVKLHHQEMITHLPDLNEKRATRHIHERSTRTSGKMGF